MIAWGANEFRKDLIQFDNRVFLSPRSWHQHCPGKVFERVPIEEIAEKINSSPALIVTIGGSEFPGNPLFASARRVHSLDLGRIVTRHWISI